MAMQVTNLDTARILEEVECLHLTRQISTCSKLFPSDKIFTTPIGCGQAAISLPIFGRKLNHVAGLGMSGPVSASDLHKIEHLYATAGLDIVIDLCPLADATVLEILGAGGYTVIGFISVYALDLNNSNINPQHTSSSNQRVTVERATADKHDTFIDLSAKGCATNGRPHQLLKTLAQCAAMRADTHLYLAFVDGHVAGSAGLALIETPTGTVAHVYIDSTLPDFRGCGVQRALIETRLTDARSYGCKVALFSARPGTASARNAERAGFRLAYIKSLFSKSLSDTKAAVP